MKIKRRIIIYLWGLTLVSIAAAASGEDFILSRKFAQPEIRQEGIIKYFPSRFAAIRRTDTVPQIDGKLDDDCWKNAAAVTDFFVLGTQSGALMKQKTIVRLAYDDRAVYLGFECEEPDLDSLVKHSMWEEGVEAFFDTTHDHRTFYQVGVTPGGTTGQTAGKTVSWDGKVDVKTSFGDERWFAEIAVPFESMKTGCPPPGTVWGLNLCRTLFGRQVYGTYPLLPGASFHAPAHFADMFFAGKEGLPYTVESIFFKDKPMLGINKAIITIRNETDKKGEFVLETRIRNASGEYSVPHSAEVTLGKGGKKGIDISYEIQEAGVDSEINMTLLSTDLKEEYYKCEYSLSVPDLAVMELSLDGDTYFLEEKTMSLFVRINARESMLKNGSLKLQLKKKKDGEIISAGEIKDLIPSDVEMTIDIADLPADEYIILAELTDKNGKVLDSKDAFFRKVEGIE